MTKELLLAKHWPRNAREYPQWITQDELSVRYQQVEWPGFGHVFTDTCAQHVFDDSAHLAIVASILARKMSCVALHSLGFAVRYYATDPVPDGPDPTTADLSDFFVTSTISESPLETYWVIKSRIWRRLDAPEDP